MPTAAPIERTESRPGMMVNTSDRWVSTDAGTLFVRSWLPADWHDNEGTILLFHDSLGCVELWRNFPQQLAIATGRRVVAYDRLGFGRSDAYSGQLASSFIVREATTVVPCLCEDLELARIIPFGHSMGGSIAVATAARWPERCAALITEAAHSFMEGLTFAGLHTAQANFERPGQLERLARYHGTKARWALDAWLNTWLSPEFANWKLDDEVRSVGCPLLALHGDRDEFGSAEHPKRIARLVGAPSKVIILQDCGHIPHREQPQRVLSEVACFLDSNAC